MLQPTDLRARRVRKRNVECLNFHYKPTRGTRPAKRYNLLKSLARSEAIEEAITSEEINKEEADNSGELS